jgi:NAD(P)H-nitrite reductase large subunit
MSDDILICRCEEVTRDEIIQAIKEGAHTVTAVKKRLRAGMGLCKGKTCSILVQRLIVEYAGKKPSEVDFDVEREPFRPIQISVLADYDEDDAIVDHELCLRRM